MTRGVKRCSCGALYNLLSWCGLPRPEGGDIQPMGDGRFLELRNCRCGSTIGVWPGQLNTLRPVPREVVEDGI